ASLEDCHQNHLVWVTIGPKHVAANGAMDLRFALAIPLFHQVQNLLLVASFGTHACDGAVHGADPFLSLIARLLEARCVLLAPPLPTCRWADGASKWTPIQQTTQVPVRGITRRAPKPSL